MRKLLHVWSTLLAVGVLCGMSSCSKDDAATPAKVSVGTKTLTFEALTTEAQTVTVDADQDWSFEVTGDVTREEGGNTLTVTPKFNYDNVPYTAYIEITAGQGDSQTTEKIEVKQDANADTYLQMLDNALNVDNPMIMLASEEGAGETEYKILLTTNNKLTVIYSEDQTDHSQDATTESRAAIEDCPWITYEIGEETTADGPVTALTLKCETYDNLKEPRIAYLEIVSGEGTKNKVVTKRLGVTQLPKEGSIVPSIEGGKLEFAYDATEPLTFSVAANVDYTYAWNTFTPDWVTLEEITEEGSKMRSFSISVDPWTGLQPREVPLDFIANEGLDVASALITIVQTAAPKASLSVDTNSLVFKHGEENKSQYVGVTTSFSTVTVTTVDNETNQEAQWLIAEYDSEATMLTVKVNGESENDRNAVITLHCGGNGNEASVQIPVTQIGATPTLVLDPETIELDAKGTAKTISVLTNQTEWEVVNAEESQDFNITTDTKNNTITVVGNELSSGSREFTYTVKAGEIEKQFTVSQKAALKVGDPYIVNGKPVGIVFEVNEEGMHGKAYSLTVYNLSDKYFCYKENATERNDVFELTEENAPLSMDDGLANQRIITSNSDWETYFQMTKWTVDLGKEQGVEWYIPAVNELKKMIEVMSDAKYTVSDSGYEIIPSVEEVTPAWNVVRALYEQYTTEENGYETEQYVVFQWANEDYTYNIDGLLQTEDSWVVIEEASAENYYQEKGNWLVTTPGDNTADRWFSSTVTKESGFYRVYTASFSYDWRGNGVINTDTYASKSIYNIDYLQDGGSIHPICQF